MVGFPIWSLCGNAIVSLTCVLMVVIGGGLWTGYSTQAPVPIEIMGRMTFLPTWREFTMGILLSIAGATLATLRLRKIKNM